MSEVPPGIPKKTRTARIPVIAHQVALFLAFHATSSATPSKKRHSPSTPPMETKNSSRKTADVVHPVMNVGLKDNHPNRQ
jgi:hypothetical protein